MHIICLVRSFYLLHLNIHIFNIFLILLLLEMLFEPSYQIPDVRELLVVKVKA